LAEFWLVPVSIVWLIVVATEPRPGRWRAPAALAFVLGLTVAQPLGIVATEQPGEPRRATAQEHADSEGVHVARLFGVIPVLPFKLYRRDVFLAGENTPTKTMRARSWLWLPILSNATEVTEMCADVFIPCWHDAYLSGGVKEVPRTMSVVRDDGAHWVVVDNGGVDEDQPTVPPSFTWKLTAGIASIGGLVYWVLAGGLVVAARRRRWPP